MRRVFAVSVFLSLAAALFALPGGPRGHGPGWMGMGDAQVTADLNAEVSSILDAYSATQIGSMTVADLEKLEGQLSVAIQKEAYVRGAAMASFALPGVGQFRTGDTLGGALFLAGDLALVAGTIVGWYYLLPANVQFGSLDYLNAPFSTIETTWKSNTLAEYLPSIAVAAGGSVAQMLLRAWSARQAEADARAAVQSGKVTFQPELVPLFGPMGQGMGAGVRFRW